MNWKERIIEIENRIKKLPAPPWNYYAGDDFDHWELWGNDSTSLIHDDSGVPPNKDFIDFILHAVEDINFLLNIDTIKMIEKQKNNIKECKISGHLWWWRSDEYHSCLRCGLHEKKNENVEESEESNV